jgi:hypothetical protein
MLRKLLVGKRWSFGSASPKTSALSQLAFVAISVRKIAKHALLTTPWFNLPFAC